MPSRNGPYKAESEMPMNADDQVVDGFGERPLEASNSIIWTVCKLCGKSITTHKAIRDEADCGWFWRTAMNYICPDCFVADMPDLGPRCAIICTGPSVKNYEPSLLSKITVPTIGVNWSYLGVQSIIHVVSNIVLIRRHGWEFDKLTYGSKYRISPRRIEGAYVPDTIFAYAGIQSYMTARKPEHRPRQLIR